VVLLGAIAGGVIAMKAMSPSTEVKPPPVAPKPIAAVIDPPKPAVVDVRFEVQSQPSGAAVTRDGVQIGVTPFNFTVQRNGTQPVQVELAFSLDGYEPHSTTAQGLDGIVTVNQALAKKAEAPKPNVKPVVKKNPKNPKDPKGDPNGYKDDPY
jgi:hypothetical protein